MSDLTTLKFDILFDVFVPSLYAHAKYLRNLLTLSNGQGGGVCGLIAAAIQFGNL